MEEIICHYVNCVFEQKPPLLPQKRRFDLNERPLTDEHALAAQQRKDTGGALIQAG